MTNAEYALLFDLRRIPQRNAHFHALHGADIDLAESLVRKGWVVRSETKLLDAWGYRLNKAGRQALYAEYDIRRQAT